MRTKHRQRGLPAAKWEILFKKAGIEREKLEATKSERARTTIIGNFLSQNVGREVPIEINGQIGKATLRVVVGSAKQKRYFFEILWDEPKAQRPVKSKDKIQTPSKVGSKKKVTTAKKSGDVVSKKIVKKTVTKPTRNRETRGNDESWG